MERYVLSHCHDERNLCLDGFFNSLPGVLSGHEDSRGIRFELFLCSPQMWKDWQPQMLSVLTGRYASDYISTISEGLLGIDGSDSTSEALIYDSCMLPNFQVLDSVLVRISDNTGGK